MPLLFASIDSSSPSFDFYCSHFDSPTHKISTSAYDGIGHPIPIWPNRPHLNRFGSIGHCVIPRCTRLQTRTDAILSTFDGRSTDLSFEFIVPGPTACPWNERSHNKDKETPFREIAMHTNLPMYHRDRPSYHADKRSRHPSSRDIGHWLSEVKREYLLHRCHKLPHSSAGHRVFERRGTGT
jgi:hypothetical protein